MKNLILRTVTGSAFVAVMVGGILYSPLTLGILFAVITALTLWEFTGVVNQRPDIDVNRLITTVAGTCLYLGFFGFVSGMTPTVAVFAPWLVSIIYLLIGELYLKRENPMNNWAFTLMAQLYVALPFSLLTLLEFGFGCNGGWLVMAVFIFLWTNDTGAYCTGSLLGRHKLFPRVSPGKSWEGSIGGGVLCIVVSQVLAHFLPDHLDALTWMGFALVVVFFGTWGDLIESLLKRQLGIKDSGHILPGHGGMLDRFDSSLLAIPAVVTYLLILTMH